MLYFIASDIHGSALWCRRMLRAFEKSGASRLVLLGDILYHGPRNDLPDEYAPKAVIEMLSAYKDRILAVRGNCEAEVDQMVLPFPVMADYAVIAQGDHLVYLTHGHKFSPDNPPPLSKGDVMLSGHTHIPMDETREGIRFVNPGSVSIPKGGSAHACLLMTDTDFIPCVLTEEDA